MMFVPQEREDYLCTLTVFVKTPWTHFTELAFLSIELLLPEDELPLEEEDASEDSDFESESLSESDLESESESDLESESELVSA